MIGSQYRSRGLSSFLAMNRLQFFAWLRALVVKLFSFGKIKSSIFFMQANSTIELLGKRSRMRIGKYAFIRKNASIRIDHEGELELGDYAFINDNCNINCVNHVSIGAYTKIAPNVCINDHDHNYRQAGDDHLLIGQVTIGEHVWIGSNVVILRDTTIGDHAVIAAGSVVKGHVPAHTLFANKREKRMIPIDPESASSPVKESV
ncbi:acyltransferase [Paenibacillus paeoniae]|uniref:Acyltransferase n=2 Tax=Paenibacillus paeoniae TaxID=2292705 RepID=A0A371PNL6_9BACL|nr:acyltransferase [Paenibacillus paeoniae]